MDTSSSSTAEVHSSTNMDASSSSTAEVHPSATHMDTSSSSTAEVHSSTNIDTSSSSTAEVHSSTNMDTSSSSTAEVHSSTNIDASSSSTAKVHSSTNMDTSSNTTSTATVVSNNNNNNNNNNVNVDNSYSISDFYTSSSATTQILPTVRYFPDRNNSSIFYNVLPVPSISPSSQILLPLSTFSSSSTATTATTNFTPGIVHTVPNKYKYPKNPTSNLNKNKPPVPPPELLLERPSNEKGLFLFLKFMNEKVFHESMYEKWSEYFDNKNTEMFEIKYSELRVSISFIYCNY